MKTIIITGASGAIGSAIAKFLDNEGNRLILIYNNNYTQIEELTKTLKCESISYKCDMCDLTKVESVFFEIQKKYDDIYGLINCAGIACVKQIQDMNLDEINSLVNINLSSIILATKILSKQMIFNKSGRIINISSMWGVVGASMESVYSATKGGLNSFTLSLAKELGPSNITVNAICPGLIDTKMNSSLDSKSKNEIINSTPIRRIGKPNDIASFVKYLISDESSFMTGQIVTIDGGLTL